MTVPSPRIVYTARWKKPRPLYPRQSISTLTLATEGDNRWAETFKERCAIPPNPLSQYDRWNQVSLSTNARKVLSQGPRLIISRLSTSNDDIKPVLLSNSMRVPPVVKAREPISSDIPNAGNLLTAKIGATIALVTGNCSQATEWPFSPQMVAARSRRSTRKKYSRPGFFVNFSTGSASALDSPGATDCGVQSPFATTVPSSETV